MRMKTEHNGDSYIIYSREAYKLGYNQSKNSSLSKFTIFIKLYPDDLLLKKYPDDLLLPVRY